MNAPKSGRPAARRSSLAGTSPTTPAEGDVSPAPSIESAPFRHFSPDDPLVVDQTGWTTEQKEQYDDAAELHERQEAEGRADEAKAAKKKPKYAPKVTFYQSKADTARVRNALVHTMASEGVRSMSQFIHEAVMAEVERLEKEHNAGQPFSAVSSRGVPRGRPIGE